MTSAGWLAGLMIAIVLQVGAGRWAVASEGGGCQEIRDSLLSYDEKAQMQQMAPVSKEFLFGNEITIRCLVEILGEMRLSVRSPQIDGQTRAQLVRVTGALRSVLTTQGNSAIQSYRNYDSPDSTIALAFAARSDDPNLRINATLILADVIDNTTVCVPIDHLYDPALLEPVGGESGRINLIGVVSVAAPWSYKQNFGNIERVSRKLRHDLESQVNVAQVREVLNNLEARLNFRAAPNKDLPLPDSLSDCKSYEPLWANRTGRNLFY